LTSSGGVFIGYLAGYSETASNKLYIANNSTADTTLIWGDFALKHVNIGGVITDQAATLAVRGDGTNPIQKWQSSAGTTKSLITAAGGAQLGDQAGGNYVNISDTDGTLTLVGNAKAWDDLRVEPVARTTGANAPTFEKWLDDAAGTSRGVYLYSFDDANAGSEKEIFFTMQMPHNWAATAVGIHVHWIGAVDDTTATPRWGMEYVWKEIGAVFGDTTTVYVVGNTAGDANITALKHYISEFTAVTPDSTQDGLSSILIGRLFRDSANAADTYNASGAKCGLLYIDAHYEIDGFGSNSEYTK
jgi:hypothetical protein